MVSFLVIGRKHTFSNRTFVIGAFICGVSILLFALVEGTVLCILTLSIMYVGFAVSAVSSSFILRMELPDTHRTQGLSFADIPYYSADIFSAICFAFLLTIFDVNTLLFGAGAGLIILCLVAFPIAHRLAPTARRYIDQEAGSH